MTPLHTHRFLHEGEPWRLLMTSQDSIGQLLPPDFNFKVHFFATDYSPGYTTTYTINGNLLMIHEIEILNGARIEFQSNQSTFRPDGHQSVLPQTSGTQADWNSEHRWEVFADLPPINGVLPTLRFYKKGDEEWVEYRRYENLNLVLDYSGGFLIAKDGGHRGFPTPHTYRHVIELCIKGGKVIEVLDQSKRVQDIIHDADDPYRAISVALSHQHPDNLHFNHRYHVLF